MNCRRRGDLDPCQLINLIETAHSRHDICSSESILLIDKILIEGGHLSSSSNSTYFSSATVRPISFQCSKFSYLSITALSTLNTGCLASLTNAVALLSRVDDNLGNNGAGSHKYEERYYVNVDAGMKTSMNPLVNYCRVYGTDDLLSCEVGINVNISANLNQDNISFSYCFASLMIHDIIVNHECSMEVIEVLAVDSDLDQHHSFSEGEDASDNCSMKFHFCILFQGKLVRGSQSDMHISSYGEACADEFEVVGVASANSNNDDSNYHQGRRRTAGDENDEMIIVENDNEIQIDNIGNRSDTTTKAMVNKVTKRVEGDITTENDEKGDADMSPLYLINYLHTQKKYYMLYCEFDGTKVHIIHTVKIDGMIKDQLPSLIKMQRPSSYSTSKATSSIPIRSVYLGGTCGCLLGIDLIDKHYRVFPLTLDDYNRYGGDFLEKSFPNSHSNSACITAIDCVPYSNSKYCHPELLQRCMVSGDHYGLVCLWNGSTIDIGYDQVLRINVESRVISLKLSRYGNQILVVLRDRLLLLGVSREMINGNICKTLYVQSVLDSVRGYRAFYACDFINTEYPASKFQSSISIWKAMEDSSSSCVFTHWEMDLPVSNEIQHQEDIYDHSMIEMEIEDANTDNRSPYATHKVENDCKTAAVSNTVLEASRALVFQQYELAWKAISSVRMSKLYRMDKTLVLMHLRVASVATLVPEETLKIFDKPSSRSSASNDVVPSARLEDITNILMPISSATYQEHLWLFDDIITNGPTSISQERLPEGDPWNCHIQELSSSPSSSSSSALLINLIPYSVDMGNVFCINTVFMICATTWRSDIFSNHNNLIKIHSLCKVSEESVCNNEDSLDLFDNSTPELLCSFNPIKSSSWKLQSPCVSAVSLSQMCTYICVSIVAISSDTSSHCNDYEISIWSMVNACTHIASIPLCSKSPPRAIDWHTSDTMLVIWASSSAENNRSWTASYLLVDWDSLVVAPATCTFSQETLQRHIHAPKTAPSSPINYQILRKASKDVEIDDVDVQDIVDTVISMKPVVVKSRQHNLHEYVVKNNLYSTQSIYTSRKWVFDDLTHWLNADSYYITSDSDDESDERVHNRIWALHAPAGFGKTAIVNAIPDLFEEIVVASFDCSFATLTSTSILPADNIYNDVSLVISIAQQLYVYFGEEYRTQAISSLSSFTHQLVNKICGDIQIKCETLIKWKSDFLASGGFSADGGIPCLQARLYSSCMKRMIERIQEMQAQLKSKNPSNEERLEFYALCELLTSFQIIVFGGVSFLLPQFSLIAVKDLFESMISYPLRSCHLSCQGNVSTLKKHQSRLVIIDGITQFPNDFMISKFIRMLALSSPKWLKIVLTSRNNGEFVKELGDLHPRIVHLYGENHFEDMKMICQSLLTERNYKGSIAEGVEILLKKADGDMKCINFLQMWLQNNSTQNTILHMSLNIDLQKFSLMKIFVSEASEKFQRAKQVLEVYCASYEPPPVSLVSAAIDVDFNKVWDIITNDLSELIYPAGKSQALVAYRKTLKKYLTDTDRIGQEFWIDARNGHNAICSLYLRFCSNKSIAVDYLWQNYLKTYGPSHFRKTTRSLRNLTYNVRKIDETSGIRGLLPYQVGYVVGLEEMYARRVGLFGHLPTELGQLKKLRVLSMGNNQISGTLPSSLGSIEGLQRIVLHQNKLSGAVPVEFDTLGCIVNLAGNRKLLHGKDVPDDERLALNELHRSTNGAAWCTSTNWNSSLPVSTWYKVGVLASHVHSLVMSSNNMSGYIPEEIFRLKHLRMIELASMPSLKGKIPSSMCKMMALKRLCICRCGIGGKIPQEIGNLKLLEELQLFGNNFTGSIPSSLSQLKNLRLLSLGEYTGGNRFDPAPIPACISHLVHIEAIFIANCNITGSIPKWIGNLRDLKQLDVQSNNLSGKVPSSVGKLTNLLYLNIKDNEALNGVIPIEELSKLTRLNRLSMVHCSFDNVREAVDILQLRLPR